MSDGGENGGICVCTWPIKVLLTGVVGGEIRTAPWLNDEPVTKLELLPLSRGDVFCSGPYAGGVDIEITLLTGIVLISFLVMFYANRADSRLLRNGAFLEALGDL